MSFIKDLLKWGVVRGSRDPLTGGITGFSVNGRTTLHQAIKPSVLMTKSMGMRLSAQSLAAANRTSSIEFVLAAPYDRVRLLLPNLHTADVVGVKVSVAPTANWSETQTNQIITPSGGVGAWIDATFSGAASGTLTASDGTTPTITATDWIDVNSIARADGSDLAMLLVRIEHPIAAGYFTMLFSNPTGWELSETVGSRTLRSTKQAVLGCTTKASVTGYGTDNYVQAAIVQYISRVPGVTIMTAGDSITEGTGGATPFYYGWTQRMIPALHRSECPVEVCNVGWGTKDSNEFYDLVNLLLPSVKPPVLVYAGFTPNNTLNAANLNTARKYLSRVRALASDYNTRLMLWSGLPSTYGLSQGKNWEAVDTLRLAFNSEMAGYGEMFCDVASVMTGGYNATNTAQLDMLATETTDGLHPNDTGCATMAAKFAATFALYGVEAD